MAGFQIPRAQRRTEDPSGVFRGRAQAPTVAARATQALGGAIVDVAQAGRRILDARERQQAEETLNRSQNAANEIQNSMVQFLADENTKGGLDTVGNVERYDETLRDRVSTWTADLSDDGKALTSQMLEPSSLRTRTKLATHQQEQRKGVTFSNLDQARDIAVQKAANTPTLDVITEQVESVSSTISLYRANNSIDEEPAQDRFTEAREEIIISAIVSATQQDPEAAAELLKETKAVLPSDTVKSLKASIRQEKTRQEKQAKYYYNES